MSEVSVKLGADYRGDGVREMIQDVRDSQAAIQRLVQSYKDLGATEQETEVAMRRETVNAKQLSIALDEVYGGAEHAASGFGSINQEARGLRVGMAGLVADMALATVASGEQLPQGLREAAKGLQTVADLAIAGNFVFPGFGLVVGGVAGALLALGTASLEVSPELQALNKEVDGLANKDATAKTLADITGWTKADAEWALTAAKNNGAFADALDKVVKDRQPPNWLDWLGKFVTNPAGALQALSPEAQFGRSLQKMSDANTLETAQMSAEWDTRKTQADGYYSQIESLVSQQIADQAQASARMIQFTQQELNASMNAAQQMTRNNAAEAEAEYRAARDLADRLGNIARDSTDKQNDLAYSHAAQLEKVNEQLAQQYTALQTRLHDISFSAFQSRVALDYNLNADLQGKTEQEKIIIRNRYEFELGQMNQKTAHEKTDAQKQYDDQKAQIEKQRVLVDSEYQHELQLNLRAVGEKVADARRSNAEQTADLKANLQTQNAIVQNNFNNQMAAIQLAKNAFVSAEGAKQAALEQTIALLEKETAILTPPNMTNAADYGVPFQRGITSHDVGGVVPGPQGAPRMILAHGGETVTKAGDTSGAKEASPQYVFVQTDSMLRGTIQDMLNQFASGHVFKEGVKVVLHTESAG